MGAAFHSNGMTADITRAAVSIRAREAWPEVAVVPIRRDLRALAKGISDEAEENNEADWCKNPIEHDLIHRMIGVAIVQPYARSASYF